MGNKGDALVALQRLDEALAVWDELLQRFGAKESQVFRQAVALGLQSKGIALLNSNLMYSPRSEDKVADVA